MHVDLALRALPITAVAQAAAQAKALGFDGVGVTESTGNPFVALAQAASATEHVRLGTAIALALPRTPMDVAYTAWDPQALSGGRLALGLGSQVRAHVERRYGAVWDRPAAVRERMTEVVGEVADGLLGHALQTADTLREVTLPALERGLEHAGRSRADIEITAGLFVATSEAEWEGIRRRVAFYGSTPGYRHVLDHHGLGSLFEQLHTLSRTGGWDAMTALAAALRAD